MLAYFMNSQLTAETAIGNSLHRHDYPSHVRHKASVVHPTSGLTTPFDSA